MRHARPVTIATVLALAACAPGSRPSANAGTPSATSTTSTSAMALCRSVLSGNDVVSAEWTTVGDARAWGHGGPVQQRPLADAFPGVADSAAATWCWTKDATDVYTAWAATAPDAVARAITISGPTTVTPHGAPVIP